MNKKLITRIQELFFLALDSKTNWGRNEIKDMYRGAVTQALLEHVDFLDKLNYPNTPDPDAGKYVDINVPDDQF
jgi:hypothetical protein